MLIMDETWFRILKRLFDLIILMLFVIILLPNHWYNTLANDETTSYQEHVIKPNHANTMTVKQKNNINTSPNAIINHETSLITDHQVPLTQEDITPKTNIIPSKHSHLEHKESIKDSLNSDLIIPDDWSASETLVTDTPAKVIADKPEEHFTEATVIPKKIIQVKAEKITKEKATTTKKVIWLQLGVFKNKKEADKLIFKLQNKNITYRLESMGNLFILKVGPITETNLKNVIHKVQEIGISNWVKTNQ